jgi:5-methylcytosine-specific restriction enzyme A
MKQPKPPPRLGNSSDYWRWKQTRVAYLHAHPYCAICAKFGVKKLATDVHHILPRRERPDLAFDWNNFQGLCVRCHSGHMQADENRGYSDETGADGWPVDPRHPSNK